MAGAAVSSLRVERDADGRSVVRRLLGAPPLGLRELRGSSEPGAPVRVAVVQRSAHLLGGDDVRLEVTVAAGARLELTEISATIVHPGALARLELAVEAGEGSRVCLLEQPLVLAAGARLERRLTLTLAAGAAALHRETLVLGRHGEAPGCARTRTRVVRAGRPLLDETLSTGDLDGLRSAAVLAEARVVGALARYGVAGPAPAGAFAIGEHDTLVRRLAARARDLAPLERLQCRWAATFFGPGARTG